MDPNQILDPNIQNTFSTPKGCLSTPQIDAPHPLKIFLQFSLQFLNLKLILGSLLDVYESCFEVWCATLIIYCLSFQAFHSQWPFSIVIVIVIEFIVLNMSVCGLCLIYSKLTISSIVYLSYYNFKKLYYGVFK